MPYKDDFAAEDYQVGYKNPPKNRQFPKGISGNPSGRPKKPTDFGSKLLRELDSKLTITENGKRKVITKSDALIKQLTNKSVSGHHSTQRLLIPLYLQELEKSAERDRRSPGKNPALTLRDLTDEELGQCIIEERARIKKMEQKGYTEIICSHCKKRKWELLEAGKPQERKKSCP